MSEETGITIEEKEEVVQEEEKGFNIEGLMPEEIEMAKESGLIKEENEDGTTQVKSTVEGDGKSDSKEGEKVSETSREDETEQGESEEVAPTFEDVDKNKDLLKKYNKNEQAFYWKSKGNVKKRQAAEKELEEYKSSVEFEKAKDLGLKSKLDKIHTMLADPDLTTDQIAEIIGVDRPKSEEEIKIEAESDVQKKQDVVRAEDEAYKERVNTAEEIGKSRYDNFDHITELAKEVIGKSKAYQRNMESAFNDSTIDESELVDMVNDMAKLHPDFGKDVVVKEGNSEISENSNASRAIKNSKKKISSASLASSGSKRTINFADITVEDVSSMNQKQWNKIPKEHQDRLLMG